MRNQVKRWLCTMVCVISAIAFVYFVVSFVTAQNAYRHSDRDLQNVMAIRGGMPQTLSKEVKSQMDEASVRAAEYEEDLAKREGYQRLMVENSDMIGWVRIEGTPVDYPVMQTLDEPDYYYRRGFDKEYSAYGMIYMDAACTVTEEETVSPNYILYGHHMKNGSMFASLEQYSSKAYYQEHPVVEFDTKDEFGCYEIIGAVRLPAERLNGEFAAVLAARTEEDYESLVRYVKEHTFYDTGIDAQWPEQLITLTTCEYTQKNGRLLVVARKQRTE